MKYVRILLAGYSMFGSALPIAVAEQSIETDASPLLPASLTCPPDLLRGCCDWYCSKPQPWIGCFVQGCGCDDYRCKPVPLIAPYQGGCYPGFYCPKPYPDLCRPIAADYFWCVSPSEKCAR